MEAGKSLQPIKRAHAIECFGVEGHRRMCGVTTGTTTGMFFQVSCVGSAVGTQKKPGAAADSCLQQGLAVQFPLQHRQAVVMRADAASKNGIAVVQQMVCGDGGGSEIAGLGYILGGLAGGDVLEHNF